MGTKNTASGSQPSATILDERSLALRRLVVEALAGGERGHIGSSMSLIEVIRVLYDDILRHRPTEPKWDGRDRFILSKGHGCIAQYAILADLGYFPTGHLTTFCRKGSILGGHPDASKVPGVEASTGSLGHGLSIGVGMALAAKMSARDSRIFVVMGDGEINEGAVWEAAISAGHHNLSNLVAIVDYNKIQSAGPTAQIANLEPLVAKWEAFGFSTREVDGHDIVALREVFSQVPICDGRPSAIVCNTVKGKGIPFAEHDPSWHHKSRIGAEVIAEMQTALDAG